MGPGRHATLGGLRYLPAVHELAAELDADHALAVAAARQAIEEQRELVLRGGEPARDLVPRARELLAELVQPSLRRVINATGVIAHTNLGRAPLALAAREAVTRLSQGYSNLEFDLASGERGSRQEHIDALLCELTGAEAAMVVNNGAAAVLLAVAALAGPRRAVIVSRGQLVEIGGGFRIPEVVAQSGSRLVEVGTTNRTRLADYQSALEAQDLEVGAILRVHQSNFRAVGFVQEVAIEDLCGLEVPVIDDVGSGVLADATGLPALGDEPGLKRSVSAGAAVVCCSGDKLLGGPQAGLLVGRAAAIAAAAAHPLARAVRIDNLSLAGLEATLQLYRDPARARREIPVLRMLETGHEELLGRARRMRAAIGEKMEITTATAKVGGGALPLLELAGPVLATPADVDAVALASALRAGDPPVIARVHEGRLMLNPRTVADDEVEQLSAAVRRALDRV